MSNEKESPTITKASKSPLRHFLLLERAREESDFRSALEAQENLKHLGVVVTYAKPSQDDQR